MKRSRMPAGDRLPSVSGMRTGMRGAMHSADGPMHGSAARIGDRRRGTTLTSGFRAASGRAPARSRPAAHPRHGAEHESGFLTPTRSGRSAGRARWGAEAPPRAPPSRARDDGLRGRDLSRVGTAQAVCSPLASGGRGSPHVIPDAFKVVFAPAFAPAFVRATSRRMGSPHESPGCAEGQHYPRLEWPRSGSTRVSCAKARPKTLASLISAIHAEIVVREPVSPGPPHRRSGQAGCIRYIRRMRVGWCVPAQTRRTPSVPGSRRQDSGQE
jgi:hypothetical protein